MIDFEQADWKLCSYTT